uniref:Uncharacterized protein n=1 Tax=Rhizophora mucronata TaxID=61149 RepID=A0A2P2IXS0_RHIMU
MFDKLGSSSLSSQTPNKYLSRTRSISGE